ncbi:LuxR C-terminal-related transcriptional regulator [Vibrio marisflavi]|uniref:CsgAB operon transcriptional regulatory protein n=1 Tax=Vibrio marisflavi CECT 7928 TaxID=634439 RepID=A0ABM9A512_9VIBR|nr:LuxR C-terminal-related transcriptional regulator [Vibrio marisflavi]CAH0540171.1 putative csgAB operon transcriptional regulatory protein [Vibrio marisflavi CECT 7928]
MKSADRITITLLSEISMQSNLLKESLESNLDVTLDILPFSKFIPINNQSKKFCDVVIIDYPKMDEDTFLDYYELQSNYKSPWKEILINCPTDIHSSDLFKWHNLVAVFYVDSNVQSLVKGVSKVLDGEMWLSRRIAQEYIQHFRSCNSINTSRAYTKLTKREKQIIHLLTNGASNVQIADELFVSENTVKTHLHNIFKKINAKNRVQALLWANNNIGIEEKVS